MPRPFEASFAFEVLSPINAEVVVPQMVSKLNEPAMLRALESCKPQSASIIAHYATGVGEVSVFCETESATIEGARSLSRCVLEALLDSNQLVTIDTYPKVAEVIPTQLIQDQIAIAEREFTRNPGPLTSAAVNQWTQRLADDKLMWQRLGHVRLVRPVSQPERADLIKSAMIYLHGFLNRSV